MNVRPCAPGVIDQEGRKRERENEREEAQPGTAVPAGRDPRSSRPQPSRGGGLLREQAERPSSSREMRVWRTFFFSVRGVGCRPSSAARAAGPRRDTARNPLFPWMGQELGGQRFQPRERADVAKMEPPPAGLDFGVFF